MRAVLDGIGWDKGGEKEKMEECDGKERDEMAGINFWLLF